MNRLKIYNNIYNEIPSTIKTIYDNSYINNKSKILISFVNKRNDNKKIVDLIKCMNTEKPWELLNNESVLELYKDYNHISDREKKKYAEIFTPLELVNDMLDKIPTEMWSDPNKKWLEPANGTGNFMWQVIRRLFNGLKNISGLEDDEIRYKHIIENMIYVCEIQTKNMFLWIKRIDFHDKYKINFYRGNFLSKKFDLHTNKIWNIDNFDLILGNPPFNSDQNATTKKGGGDTIWDKFVIKSMFVLKERGLLCFVHPTLWRKPQSERSSSNEVSKMMMKKQIHYLEMHNSADGMKTFNAGTRYDFYLLENCDIYTNTTIKDEDKIISNVDLRLYDFIPNKGLEFFNKIVAKKGDEKCPIIFNRTNYGSDKEHVSSDKTDVYKYTLVHTTPQKGIRYKYSSVNDKGHFGISKIIFGDSGIYNVIIDMAGEFGMTEHSMAIKVSNLEEAENIKKVILCDSFTEFLESVMWSNFQIDWRLFNHLKKDFWKYFN